MTARTDSFEGLHVLLVTEDDARAQAIARSLRERKAHVGDVRAGAKDPVALRGADLLVIDARRAASTDARVSEVRSDVRARWASVATIDYTALAGSDGTVDLRALEGIVSRLAGMDKALTDRARKENSFETMLAPLGPTRTLRALALAGPTLHVELRDGTLTASVDLADELLVASFAERDGQRWEAWTALARVLGMTDANVTVERRAHPSAMNIMEPVDQALESAAQERARSPELFAEPVEELSGLHSERKRSAVGGPTAASAIAPAAAPSIAPAPAAPASAPAAASSAPASTPAAASSAPAAPRPRPLSGSGSASTGTTAPAARPSVPLPSMQTPATSTRPSFGDVPTDPAAPGLLQRMARGPANDGPPKPQPKAQDPELSFERTSHDDRDFDGTEQEYDAGEVTVVADASQLDMLRETLGRLDAEPPGQPLTSTMPAPKPSGGPVELENVEPLRAASEPAPAAPAGDEVSGRRRSLDVVGDEGDTPIELAAPKLKLNEQPSPRKPEAAPSKTSAWVVIVLLVLAGALVTALYLARSQG